MRQVRPGSSSSESFPDLDRYLLANRRKLVGWAASLLGSHLQSEAEDCVQITATKIWQSRARYRRGEPMDAWFRFALRNVILDVKQHYRRVPIPDSIEDVLADEHDGWHPLSREGTPEDVVVRRLSTADDESRLLTIIQQLPAPIAQILTDVYVYDIDREKIAAGIGTTPRRLRNMLCTARKQLRAIWPEAFESGTGGDGLTGAADVRTALPAGINQQRPQQAQPQNPQKRRRSKSAAAVVFLTPSSSLSAPRPPAVSPAESERRANAAAARSVEARITQLVLALDGLDAEDAA